MVLLVVKNAMFVVTWLLHPISAMIRKHILHVGEGNRRDEPRDELIPGLPNDVVIGEIWPKLVRYSWSSSGSQVVDRIRTMRAVNVAWNDMVGLENHWVALQQLIEAGQPRPEWIADGWSLDEMLDFLVECMRVGLV